MAAFEAISRVIVQTIGRHGDLEVIDVRYAKLPRDRPPITNFDPRNYRTPRVEIRPWMAYFNLLRNTFGTSVLGATMAISQVGVIIGPLLFLLTGLLLIHTHLILLWCLNEISRQMKIANVSYRYGFRMALLHGPPILHQIGNAGPCIIATFMMICQIAICASLVIFTADNLRDIADWESNTPAIFTLFFPFLIFQTFMKNLKIISKVILAGTYSLIFLIGWFFVGRNCMKRQSHVNPNFLNLFGFILVIYHITIKPGGDDLKWLPIGWIAVLNAFGTTLFNLSAVAVVLSCEKALKNPRIMTKRNGVVRLGIMVPTVVSILIGSAGYYAFGGMEENILRYLPFDDYSALICIAFYMITTALSYPLQCYPCIQIAIEVIKNHDPYVSPSNACITGVEYIARPIFVVGTFMLAHFVPIQGPLVAFIGSFCTTLLVLVFPALMEIGLCYPDNFGRYNYILIKDLLIVVLGLVCWASGTCLCGYLIYIRLLSIEPHEEYL